MPRKKGKGKGKGSAARRRREAAQRRREAQRAAQKDRGAAAPEAGGGGGRAAASPKAGGGGGGGAAVRASDAERAKMVAMLTDLASRPGMVQLRETLSVMKSLSFDAAAIEGCVGRWRKLLTQIVDIKESKRLKAIATLSKNKKQSFGSDEKAVFNTIVGHLIAGITLSAVDETQEPYVLAICHQWCLRLLNQAKSDEPVVKTSLMAEAFSQLLTYLQTIDRQTADGKALWERSMGRFIQLLHQFRGFKFTTANTDDVSDLDVEVLLYFRINHPDRWIYVMTYCFRARDAAGDCRHFEYAKDLLGTCFRITMSKPIEMHRSHWNDLFVLSLGSSRDLLNHTLKLFQSALSYNPQTPEEQLLYSNSLAQMIYSTLIDPIDPGRQPFCVEVLLLSPNQEFKVNVLVLSMLWVRAVLDQAQMHAGDRPTTRSQAVGELVRLRDEVPMEKLCGQDCEEGILPDYVSKAVAVITAVFSSRVCQKISERFGYNWYASSGRKVKNQMTVRVLFSLMSGTTLYDAQRYPVRARTDADWQAFPPSERENYRGNILSLLIHVELFPREEKERVVELLSQTRWCDPQWAIERVVEENDVAILHELLPFISPNSVLSQAMTGLLDRSDNNFYRLRFKNDFELKKLFLNHLIKQLPPHELAILSAIFKECSDRGVIYHTGNLLKYTFNGRGFLEPADMDVMVLVQDKGFFSQCPVSWQPYQAGSGSPVIRSGRDIRQYHLRVGGVDIDINVHFLPDGTGHYDYVYDLLKSYAAKRLSAPETLQYLSVDAPSDLSSDTLDAEMISFGVGPKPGRPLPYSLYQRVVFHEMDIRTLTPPDRAGYQGTFMSWVKVLISQMKSLFAWCQFHEERFTQLVFPALRHFFDAFDEQMVGYGAEAEPVNPMRFSPSQMPWVSLLAPLLSAQTYAARFGDWMHHPGVSTHCLALLLCFLQAQSAEPGTHKAAVFDRRLRVFDRLMGQYSEQASLASDTP